MTITELFRRGFSAMVLGSWALPLPGLCAAETADDKAFAALQAEAKKTFQDQVTPFVKTYCWDCHGDKKMKGGITFAPSLKNPGDVAAGRKWRQALANVKAHDMPPDDVDKQPTEAERQMFMDWVGQVRYLSPKDPGTFVIRRLTKLEYANTLHDLLGVDPAVADELPDEVVGAGYLNTLSPLQSEQYLGIAHEALNRVFAPPGAPPTEVQRRLLGAPPGPGVDSRVFARKVAVSLAKKAYRRPATEAEVDVLVGVSISGQKTNSPTPTLSA